MPEIFFTENYSYKTSAEGRRQNYFKHSAWNNFKRKSKPREIKENICLVGE